MILESTRQEQVTVGVQVALIAGPEPAVGERLAVGLRVVLVFADHRGTLDHDLPSLPAPGHNSTFVHDRYLDTGAAANRSQLSCQSQHCLAQVGVQ